LKQRQVQARHWIGILHQEHARQSIINGVQYICQRLNIEIVSEGVETAGEYHWLREAGVSFFQGYYFARPEFEALPDVVHGALAT
jgi:EAL domain-containing protein (putative c-di-GMP-specific phosphodiesterase class I)